LVQAKDGGMQVAVALRSNTILPWRHASFWSISLAYVKKALAAMPLRLATRVSGTVKLYEWALLNSDSPGILANVADVVNATGQDLEIAIFDGLQGRDFQLRVLGDLFQRDSPCVANRSYGPAIHRQGCHTPLLRRDISVGEGSHCRSFLNLLGFWW